MSATNLGEGLTSISSASGQGMLLATAIVFMLSALFARGDFVSTQEDLVSTQAAQLELLVLRTSLPRDAQIRRDEVVVAPRSEATGDAQAVEALATMPKPLTCTARATPAGLLVDCEPVQAGEPAMQHNLYVQAMEVHSEPGGSITSRIGADGELLVEGRGESMVVSASTFERWYRDYELPDFIGLAFRWPTAAERADGVAYVMIVHRAEPIDQQDLQQHPVDSPDE